MMWGKDRHRVVQYETCLGGSAAKYVHGQRLGLGSNHVDRSIERRVRQHAENWSEELILHERRSIVLAAHDGGLDHSSVDIVTATAHELISSSPKF